MLQYKVIEIFTGEEARWQGRPLHEAVVRYVRDLKIAARCLVTRAGDGCYENGEIATRRLEILSANLPLHIAIVLPAGRLEGVLPVVTEMVTEGIVAVRDLTVVAHKTRKSGLPRHIRVRDIMTAAPAKVTEATPLDQVVRLLLTSVFTGVPVVDDRERPVGIISQGDLIYRAGMPMRLGLLAESDGDRLAAVLQALAGKKAEDAMTRPAVVITEESLAGEAVGLMIDKGVKRLPVVNGDGRLTGMLSRLDIFRTIMQEAPNWQTFREQQIQIGNLHLVADIMRRDTQTVPPEASLEEVIRIIDANDIQRVAVVDGDGRFLGLISDRDLLITFASAHHEGIWSYLASRVPFTERGRKYREFRELLQARTAAEVMNTDIVTVQETDTIDEAMRLMTARGLKRLPVLDALAKFRGMISRDSLLRTGFGQGG
jgi:CBS domain-containing protein